LLLASWTTCASEAWARDQTAFGEPFPPIAARAANSLDTVLNATSMPTYRPGAARSAQGPFTASSRDPTLEMLTGATTVHAHARAACERSTTDLCYDFVDRRIDYRPARQYMPQLAGLTAESVSLRRDSIRLKYSFR
jgi:hypothetical protein